MKLLTICTHNYSQMLECFVARAVADSTLTIRRRQWAHSKLVSAVCAYNPTSPVVAQKLTNLLVDIALQENPVYKQSAKLREMAADLRVTPIYDALCRDVTHFIKHSRVLHLEGYVTFRMSEYREKLDIMSYSLIKKLKLIRQD